MSAPSLWLHYNDNFDGDLLTMDIYVPSSGLYRYTYYCALQFSFSGGQSGGYCGIQDQLFGRHNLIFSLWDPKGTNSKIRASYTGSGTNVERFGGEGTGLKSTNYSGDIWGAWREDRWYTLQVRRWSQNNHSFFGFYVTDKSSNQTKHIVDFEYPVPNVYFHGSTGSFLEDWNGTGGSTRAMMLGTGGKRGLDGRMHYFTSATFSVNGSGSYAHSFNAETRHDGYYLQAGNGTVPKNGAHNGMTLTRHKKRQQEELPDKAFCFTHVTPMEVTWSYPATNSPQFRYTVKVDGVEIASEINGETRQYFLQTPAKKSIEVEIEDLLGRVSSQFHWFSHV